MQISLNLGSHNTKKYLSWSNSRTLSDLQNHGLNYQLCGRPINCNVTDGLCALCHHEKINASLLRNHKVDRYRFCLPFPPFSTKFSAEFSLHQVAVETSGAFTVYQYVNMGRTFAVCIGWLYNFCLFQTKLSWR